MSDVECITTMDDFESVVEVKDLAYVLFTSPDCKHCGSAHDALSELNANEVSSLSCYTVDYKSNRDICEQFSVNALPTVIVLKKGKVVGSLVGKGRISLESMSRFMLF